MRKLLAFAIPLALAASASAQSNVDTARKFAFGENIGFVNWRNAGSPSGSQGVRLHPFILSGFAWGENVGFINFGDGTPLNNVQYNNFSNVDFGVNRNPNTGNLTGLAWGENIGWINFAGGSLATPPNPARFDAVANRLRGFAWGENVGWINLDDANIFVSFNLCPCDWNRDGALNSQDFFDFLINFFQNEADFSGDGITNSQDFFDFITCFFAGCS